MVLSLAALLLGYLLDLCFGDPDWLPHPIRLIGRLITYTEKILRKCFPKSYRGEFWGGVCLVFVVVLVSTTIPLGILYLAGKISWVLQFIVESIMCYQILATKALKVESMKVYDQLAREDLPMARKAVSMIVGRDTANLTAEGIAKATVETIAENTSDGVVAPLLFTAVGGAPLGFFYKAVNTMDSMVGYKNDRYLYFGRFAAKLDDIFNYIPARLCALLMIGAAFLLKLDGKQAWRIWRRDSRNHASPNSAQTEAVCAGALRIQLAGDAYYFGKLLKKPTIGTPLRAVTYEDIKTTNRLMVATSAYTMAAVLITGIILYWVLIG